MNKAPLIAAVTVAGEMKLSITWNTGEVFPCDVSDALPAWRRFLRLPTLLF